MMGVEDGLGQGGIKSKGRIILVQVAQLNMGDEPIRFGILGCAMIARKISRALQRTPGACLYALGSRSLEKAQAFAATNNLLSGVKLYGSYEAVLDDEDVAAVYVPLPTSLHLEWVLKAAEKKKHVLLEKPPALTVEDFDKMLLTCQEHGVQLMDGTMWLHHPRTTKMKEVLCDHNLIGDVLEIEANSSFSADPAFLRENIRVKPDLDALGVLGDLGWYAVQAALWAADYELPYSVTALPNAKKNKEGVILSCGAILVWKSKKNGDGLSATLHCSYLTNTSMKLSIHGTKGALEVDDLAIPFVEDQASFKVSHKGNFDHLHTGWTRESESHQVQVSLPQECLMIQRFCMLVKDIRDGVAPIDMSLPEKSRKTQLLLNVIKASIDQHYNTIVL